jgi:hypothetical protein
MNTEEREEGEWSLPSGLLVWLMVVVFERGVENMLSGDPSVCNKKAPNINPSVRSNRKHSPRQTSHHTSSR